MAATPMSPNAIGEMRYLKGSNLEVGITALAGGAQAGTALTAQISRVDTVASGNDSVTLPKIKNVALNTADPGSTNMIMFIHNADASNSMQLFGTTPDTINSVATGTGVAIAAGKSAIVWCDGYTASTDVGTWQMVLSA